MSSKTYDQLVKQVQVLTERIANNPLARLEVRQAFYERYGYVEQDGHNYGRSELAFLKWEIKRGVLNPLDDDTQPGSAWWRNVNLHFIFLSELAGAMKENDVTHPDAPMPTLKWLEFINNPTPENWYTAHNATILDGFKRYEGCALLENKYEIKFLNITLYRLLFAQAMVEETTLFPDLIEEFADPRSVGVKLITSLPDFYPPRYPLTEEDLKIVLGKEGGWQDDMVFILDTLIKSRLHKLYEAAAKWNDSPFATDFIKPRKFFNLNIPKAVYAKRQDMPNECLHKIGI